MTEGQPILQADTGIKKSPMQYSSVTDAPAAMTYIVELALQKYIELLDCAKKNPHFCGFML